MPTSRQKPDGPEMKLLAGYKTGVYAIINKTNGKRYVGSAARDFKTRWSQHFSNLKKNQHGNQKLQRAWLKYGASSFQFVVILVCDSDDCLMYEQQFIDGWNTVNDDCGYNICPIAGSLLGKPRSPEASKKTADKLRGRKRESPCQDVRDAISQKIKELHRNGVYEDANKARAVGKGNGRKCTAEEVARMKGRKASEESRKKMSEAQLALNKTIPEDMKKYLSKINTGKKHSDETKKKLALLSKGRTHTDDSKMKMSEAAKGRKHTPESRQKMSESRKKYKQSSETIAKSVAARHGKKRSAATRAKLSAAAQNRAPHSPETIEKIASKNRGRKLSLEHRQKISESLKGGHCSDEAKRKIGEANRGRKLSLESRKKMSDSHKGNQTCLGRKMSEETKLKISLAKRGSKHSPETREKMSAAHRGKKRSPQAFANMEAAQKRLADARKAAQIRPKRQT